MEFSKIPNWNFRHWQRAIYEIPSSRLYGARLSNALGCLKQRHRHQCKHLHYACIRVSPPGCSHCQSTHAQLDAISTALSELQALRSQNVTLEKRRPIGFIQPRDGDDDA